MVLVRGHWLLLLQSGDLGGVILDDGRRWVQWKRCVIGVNAGLLGSNSGGPQRIGLSGGPEGRERNRYTPMRRGIPGCRYDNPPLRYTTEVVIVFCFVV